MSLLQVEFLNDCWQAIVQSQLLFCSFIVHGLLARTGQLECRVLERSNVVMYGGASVGAEILIAADHSFCFQASYRCLCTFMSTKVLTIVYDNACNTVTWLGGRQSFALLFLRILVDRLHWYNHTDCSWFSCASGSNACSGANSVLEEQANVTHTHLRKLSAFLNQPRYPRPANRSATPSFLFSPAAYTPFTSEPSPEFRLPDLWSPHTTTHPVDLLFLVNPAPLSGLAT